MNIDIRLKLDVFEHPKIRKLQRRLGPDAVLALLRLWLWAAANRADGTLNGLDADDLELAADWRGQEGELVRALCEFRLLERRGNGARGGETAEGNGGSGVDGTDGSGVFAIHGWAEHQAWASRSDERSRNARKAAQTRWDSQSEARPQARRNEGRPEGRTEGRESRNERRDVDHQAASQPEGSAGDFAGRSAGRAGMTAEKFAEMPAQNFEAVRVQASPKLCVDPHPSERKKVEIPDSSCANMRLASASNAPRAKNQEPVQEPFPVEHGPAEHPAPVREAQAGAGQGGAGEKSGPHGGQAGAQTAAREAKTSCSEPHGRGLGDISANSGACEGAHSALTGGTSAQFWTNRTDGADFGRSDGTASPASPGRPASAGRSEGADAPSSPTSPNCTATAPPWRSSEGPATPGQTVFPSTGNPPDSPASLARPSSPGRGVPTLEQVEMYCALRGNGISARRFVDYYGARGWRIGGRPMQDWQATVRVWEQRDRAQGRAATQAGRGDFAPAPHAAPHAPPDAPAPAAWELMPAAPSATALAAPGAGVWGKAFPQPPEASNIQPIFAYSSLRAGTVHQAIVRERDMLARLLLCEASTKFAKDPKVKHARPQRYAETRGAAQPALPPEWAQ